MKIKPTHYQVQVKIFEILKNMGKNKKTDR